MLIWNRELWLIDHGAALYFHHSWSDPQKYAKSPFALIKDHVLLPQAGLLPEIDVEFRSLLTEEKIRNIVNALPAEWLQWPETDENAEEIKETYIQFLLSRLKHSEIFIKEAQDARKAVI